MKFLDEDLMQESHDNKIVREKLSNIQTGIVHYLEHSIFFADSLIVYPRAASTFDERLILGTDYHLAKMDSIASELSNKDCYRALVFTSNYAEVFVDYHCYGDVITAAVMNLIMNTMQSLGGSITSLLDTIETIKTSITYHSALTAAHGSTHEIAPSRIVQRTESGAVKVPQPAALDEAVPLKTLSDEAAALRLEIQEKITSTENAIEAVRQSLIAAAASLVDTDFYPLGTDPNNPTPAQLQAALAGKKTRAAETKPFYNAVRNENGSVIVPSPRSELEAGNKKYIDDQDAALHAVLTTAYEAADAALKNAYEAADAQVRVDFSDDIETQNEKISAMQDDIADFTLNAAYTDIFNVGSTEVRTNKTWGGKIVYRQVLDTGLVNLSQDWSYQLTGSLVIDVVAVAGYTHPNASARKTPLPNIYFYMEFEGDTVYLRRNINNSIIRAIVTIEYTKD